MAAREAAEAAEPAATGTPAPETARAARRGGGERRIRGGCWQPGPGFFVQTQHGKFANRGRWKNRRPGWTRLGIPNYWGQFSHGNLGFGRCNERGWTNDMYAIDYPLRKGNAIFSPFNRGRVTFAGRNNSHRDYGIFVVIKSSRGRYVSMSAHLSGLRRGIRKGKVVTKKSIIGFAGRTGGGRIPVGGVHLHQAFYRKPSFRPDGSPYGGQGLKVIYHRYVGTAARGGSGRYKYGWNSTRRVKSERSFVSN